MVRRFHKRGRAAHKRLPPARLRTTPPRPFPQPFFTLPRPQAGKYGFRIGTFNIFPSFTVTCLMITAMGVLPYYVKYGMSGEQPRAKDDFERYKQQQSYWETVRGGGGPLPRTRTPRPPRALTHLKNTHSLPLPLRVQGNAFLQTQLVKRNEGREAMEAEWRAKHKALQ